MSLHIAATISLSFLDKDRPSSLTVSTDLSINQNSSVMHESLQGRYSSMSLDLLILAMFVALVPLLAMLALGICPELTEPQLVREGFILV